MDELPAAVNGLTFSGVTFHFTVADRLHGRPLSCRQRRNRNRSFSTRLAEQLLRSRVATKVPIPPLADDNGRPWRRSAT